MSEKKETNINTLDFLIKTLAIIAHVDHGKSTFLGSISKIKSLDTNQLEKEKGITIMSKCVTISYKGNKINFIDTPGHAAFSTEVIKGLQLCNGAILILDAREGAMPQTYAVMKEALDRKLKFIILINKVDRDHCDPINTATYILDYLSKQDESYIDTPIFYGSGMYNVFSEDLDEALAKINELKKNSSELKGDDLLDYTRQNGDNSKLMDKILEFIPNPVLSTPDKPLKMMVSFVFNSGFYERLLVGKIYQGSIKKNDELFCFSPDGKKKETFKAKAIFNFEKNGIQETDNLSIGEIGAIWGSSSCAVNDTISGEDKFQELFDIIKPESPRLSVNFYEYKPLGNLDKHKCDFIKIIEFLKREKDINPGLIIDFKGNCIEVSGISELQIAILISNMTRKDLGNLSFIVSPSKITLRKEKGKLLEPYEKVQIFLPKDRSEVDVINKLIEKLNSVGGVFLSMEDEPGLSYKVLVYEIAAKDFLKIKPSIRAISNNSATFHQVLLDYRDFKENQRLKEVLYGRLLNITEGTVTNYSLERLENHGSFFYNDGDLVFSNEVVGLAKKNDDVSLNLVIAKELTNIRSATKEIKEKTKEGKLPSLDDLLLELRSNERLYCNGDFIKVILVKDKTVDNKVNN